MNLAVLIGFHLASLATIGLSVSGTGRGRAPVGALTLPAGMIAFTAGGSGSIRSGSAGNSFSSSGSSYRYGKQEST